MTTRTWLPRSTPTPGDCCGLPSESPSSSSRRSAIEAVLDSGSPLDHRLEHVDDQGPMGGVVPVGEVSGFVVEIGDEHEIPVRVRQSGVGSESVVAHGRDLATECSQRVYGRDLRSVGCLGGPLEHNDMAEHDGDGTRQ